MKHFLPIITFVAVFFGLFPAHISAQTQDNALYVYRNDGTFSAFLHEDLDSIVLSHYDANNVYQSECVMQEFYTADSTYRIPIAAIDSVSFVQPAIIYNSKLVQMETSGMYSWLDSADGMTLYFKSAIPSGERPRINDVLLYTGTDSTFFVGGFAGKVSTVEQQTDGRWQVNCDSLSDMRDIFKRFVAVEKFDFSSSTNAKRNTAARLLKYGDKTGKSNLSIDLQWNDPSQDVSMTGGVEGYLEGRAVYYIDDTTAIVNFALWHTWTLKAQVKAEISAPYEPTENLKALPISIKFPLNAPVFELSADFAPYLKMEGNMAYDISLESPEYAYCTWLRYVDGDFTGGHRKLAGDGATTPTLSAAFSLNGSVQAGAKIEFYLGTWKKIGVFGAVADLCIGPKISGTVELKKDDLDADELYKAMKDSKVELSGLAVDAELKGEAKFMGRKIAEHTFAKSSLNFFTQEWYIFPEFTTPVYQKGSSNTTAIISTQPSRDILLPVNLGIGVENSSGEKVATQWSTADYQYKADWTDKLTSTFYGLSSGTYKAYPYVRILGLDLRATPSCEFETDKSYVDLSNFTITSRQHEAGAFLNDGAYYDYKFGCSVTATLNYSGDIDDWGYVYEDLEGNIKLISLKSYNSPYTDSRYAYYRNSVPSYVRLYGYVLLAGTDNYLYDAPQDFKLTWQNLCSDENHPHMIDLGLPSGTKWACCNVGASAPEGYGGYYAWGETEEKSNYTWSTYSYCNGSYDTCYDIGSNISGTSYDVACVKWGGSWRMPTYTQMCELIDNCTSTWTTQNGVYGQLVTGSNGNSIFLPAAGDRVGTSLINAGSSGYYWLSTVYESLSHLACRLFFNNSYFLRYYDNRYYGFSVRPVAE